MINYTNVPSWIAHEASLSEPRKRVYWDDVKDYPEIIMGIDDFNNSLGAVYKGWAKKHNKWQGCLRVMPFGNHGKFRRCRLPLKEGDYCYHHVRGARKDGKIVVTTLPPIAKPSWLGKRVLDAVDRLKVKW